MPIDKKFYIHSRGGLIGAEGVTTAPDVDAILAALEAAAVPRHLTLHFHGGLVSKDAGFQIAEHLLPVYQAGGFPVFYVWESGAWETIRNNLTELADEPVFKQLLRKVLEYALKRLGGTNGARSISPGQVDPEEVKNTLETFISNPGPDTIPYRNFEPVASQAQMRAASMGVDEAEIQADLEGDDEFRRALATLPDIPPNRRSALLPKGAATERRTPFALAASERFSEKPGQRGLISFAKAALFIKDVLVGVIGRYHRKRDHGLYATCVEEIARTLKFGGSGVNEWGKALEWNRMKQDCRDAFGSEANRAGSALLVRIRDAMQRGVLVDRITLIGHSTGAIYICEWLEAAEQLFPASVTFDVVLLAPAVTYTRFASALRKVGPRIGNFRMFAMSDPLERDDQVWGDNTELQASGDWRRFIYPSSLLYLVSGILESAEDEHGNLVDEADTPLLGMERFFSGTAVYAAASFPDVHEVREWLKQDTRRTVWSRTVNADAGLASLCNDHGAFDNEKTTIDSLKHIIVSGF